ncbi:unnamed protein product [Meloidogyne enterolobii]|uniref:Uncharacterized protein n=1 Tax=Meloidogyne enterolobii TaxID=390850 RepID=A0ACB0XX91_MELEN
MENSVLDVQNGQCLLNVVVSLSYLFLFSTFPLILTPNILPPISISLHIPPLYSHPNLSVI